MSIWTSAFWKDTIERTFFTAAESAVGLFVVDQLDVLNLDAHKFVSTAAAITFAAFLKSVIANRTVPDAISPASFAK